MNTILKAAALSSLLPVLMSCQSTNSQTAGVSYGACGDRLSPGHGLELSIATDLLQQGKPRSALAHLEELAFPYPDARILQADALRQIGNLDASDQYYKELEGSCLAAKAYRGRALNAVERRQLRQALLLMAEARQAAPTDADIRNDLGYLMLLDGNHSAAEEELLTALELNQAHINAAQNLVLLYLHRGQHDQAYRAARAYGIPESSLSALAENVNP